MKKINTSNDEWDELEQEIDSIDERSADYRASQTKIKLNKQDLTTASLIVNGKSILSNSDELGVSDTKKKRRRSELNSNESESTALMGYSQRAKRLNDELEFDGQQSSESKIEFNRLFAKGVYLLGMREHSVHEMTGKLNAKSEMPDIVLAVIDELLENNFLSDERFAESYVRSRQNRGFGPIKIRSELQSKGVTSRLIGEFLDPNSPYWIDVAREAYQKKYLPKPLTDYKEWAKRARFMQSRGFTMEHIQVVMPNHEYD